MIYKIISELRINTECVLYDDFVKLKISGIVSKKYIDSLEHNYPTLELKDFSGRASNKITLQLETSDLFNKIKISDTMFKERNTDSVFVIRSRQKELLSKVDFGCIR